MIITRVGITPEERRQAQIVELDLTIELDLKAAGQSDDINDTVDYYALMKRVETAAGARSFKLLEALTQAVANCVLKDERIARVRVRAAKRYPIGMDNVERVSVEITRER